jgi:glycosyltransferase involved in cell wall biosynthesis
LQLVLAGQIDERTPIDRQLVDKFARDSRVRLLGFVEDVELLLAASSVNVLPTYREGFGNVLLEAAAMEVPSVATKVSGCIDAVVHGETGLLVPPRAPAEMAAAISMYLENPSLARQHGQQGRQRALTLFQPEVVWNDLLETYRSLVDGSPAKMPRP